jgi:hypothetical protein
MTKILTIRHVIPTSDEELSNQFITFYRWLPNNLKKDILVRKVENRIISLWLDKNCIGSVSRPNEEEIKNWVNILINKVYVDVNIIGVPNKISNFIYNERDSPKQSHYGIKPGEKDYDKLKDIYKDLGEKVLQSALEIYNRFISFARNEKGQYWLRERQFDKNRIRSMNIEFYSKVRSTDYDWVRWCPPATDNIIIYVKDNESSIREDEWKQIKRFIKGNSRSNLVLELLANAQSLLDSNHRRSAIIESISALEVAVSRFVKTPNISSVLPPDQAGRFYVQGLKKTFEEIHLLSTIEYVMPLLFSSEIFPTEILNQTIEAIKARNSVVHHGQRDISEEKIRPLVSAVIKTCKILIKYTT